MESIFHKVTTTREIADEFRKDLPNWVEVKEVNNKEYQTLLQLEVDNGEASAIALSIEDGNALLIIDDNKARKLAARLLLSYTGTLGVIFKAKQLGIIPHIKPIIEKMQATNFRVSKKNYEEILRLANEL